MEDHFIESVCGGESRLAFAAWLDSQGRHSEATGQRWAEREGKSPMPFGWCTEVFVHQQPKCSELPAAFFEAGRAGVHLNGANPIEWERQFLHACALVEWDADGNPVTKGYYPFKIAAVSADGVTAFAAPG